MADTDVYTRADAQADIRKAATNLRSSAAFLIGAQDALKRLGISTESANAYTAMATQFVDTAHDLEAELDVPPPSPSDFPNLYTVDL